MKKKIIIDGMSCKHCINHVTEALMELEGISSVDVYLDDKMAMVETTKDIANTDIENVLADFGYTVRAISNE